MQIRAIGIAWYRRSDWKRLLTLFPDRDRLHSTYDKWLGAAEKGEREFKRKGHIVERVYIDPDEFPGWCASRGLEPDASARNTFASEAVAIKYGNQS